MSDLLLALALVLLLFPIFYVVTGVVANVYSVGFFFLIMIPTMMTLIGGAPFVPTPMAAVKKMAEVAKLKKGHKVCDIGCGDGRAVYIAANKYGADATGYELSPLVYGLARLRKLFWRSKAKILFRNFKTLTFHDVDVIMCYLLPETLATLQPKLEKELKKGAKVVSYAFQISGWTPKHIEPKNAEKNLSPIYVYEM